MRNIFARRPEDEAPEAAEPTGWDRLHGGAKIALAVAVVGGVTCFVMFSGGSPQPRNLPAKGADPAPNERINDYQPPPARGVIETMTDQVSSNMAALGMGAPRGRPRRPPTEMALYSASGSGSASGQSGDSGQSGGGGQRRANSGDGAEGGSVSSGPRGGAGEDDPLAAHLADPTALPTMRAVVTRNRDFVIEAGADIPCLPVDAQNSALPGFTKCRVPEWFRGTNMRRGLLPPGTVIFGQLRNGVAQGQKRLGYLYTQIQSPWFKVGIAAPGADAMGRPGGEADEQTFFWDRAGAVALYALLDAGIGAAQAAGSAALAGAVSGGRGGNVLSLGNIGGQAQGLAAQEMQSRLNRPSVLTRDQAMPMTVTVGQELDFTDACRRAMRVNPMACPLM